MHVKTDTFTDTDIEMTAEEYEEIRSGVCETLGDGECPWWPICETE